MEEHVKGFTVLIVGAGPSGLLLAILLARDGIPVTVLEKSVDTDRNPRASFYSSPTIYELRRAGLMDDIMKLAFLPDGVTWRYMDGTAICAVESSNPPGEETMISLPLDELLPIMVDHLARYPKGQILLGHEVLSIEQNENGARATVKTASGIKEFEASFLVGCDGANSKVRHELFGTSFPGFTWEEQIVATNVYYPRLKSFDWTACNFMISREHFPMIAQIANDGLLRITYGEKGNLTRDEMRARLPWKYKQFVPGAPEPDEYEVKNFSPYRIHQRCAERLRVGRILLVADAAHLCNPFGGMGLTGGLVDAGNLFDCLNGIYTGQADDSILDKYSEIRIQKFKEIIDPISRSNLTRLWDSSDDAISADPFFQAVERAKVDAEFAQRMKTGLLAVMHDFTQYFKGRGAANGSSIN